MLLGFVLFLICASVLKGEDNSDDGKFIDMLPEKDKEDFLQNVARRIVEEVHFKGHLLKSNEEVPESHLDMQSDFVSRLLKEEQANLLRRNSKDKVKNNVRRDTSSIDDESVKAQTLKKEKIDGSSSEGHNRDNIDLTLRDGKIVKIPQKDIGIKAESIAQDTTTVGSENDKKDSNKDDLSIEITVKDNKLKTTAVKKQKYESPIIPVKVVYDTNKQNILEEPAATTVKTESLEKNVKEGTTYFEKHRDDDFDNTRKPVLKEKAVNKQLTTVPDLNENTTGTIITEITINKEKVSKKPSDNSKSENQINAFIENNKTLIMADDDFTINTTTTSREERISYNNTNIDEETTERLSTNDIKKNNVILSPKGSSLNKSQDIKPNEVLDSNLSQDIEGKELKISHSNRNTSNINFSKIIISTPTAVKLTTELVRKLQTKPDALSFSTKSFDEITEHNTEGDKTNLNSETQILRSHKNIESYVVTTESPERLPNTKKKFFRMSRMKKRNLMEKPNPILEQQVVFDNNAKEFDSKTFYQLQKKYRRNKAYRVYEISPGKLPFSLKNPEPKTNDWVRTDRRTNIEETPYYVPVHDYAPGNAYYNPYNRLGPNNEDAEEDNIESRKKFLSVDKIAEETPYYVPVHNYAPGNAYYNSYNRLGLNNQDTESREVFGDQSIDKREDNIFAHESGRKRSHRHKNSNNNEKHKQKPHKAPSGALLDDSFDMDYYFGREGRVNVKSFNTSHKRKYNDEDIEYDNLRYPGSDEYSHPYNAIHREKLKDHISSVRQIMFNNKLWGVIPDKATTKKLPRKTKMVRIAKLQTGDDNKKILKSNYGNVVFVSPINSPQHEEDDEPDNHFGRIVDSREFIDKYMTKQKNKFKHRNRKPTPRVSIICTSEDRRNYMQCKADNKETKETKVKKTMKPTKRKKQKPKITAENLMLVANMSDARDVVELVLKMQTIKRSKDNTLDAYLTVLEDMIRTNNKGLYKYDWLETAVDIQAALKRLLHLIKQLQDGGTYLHPSDFQLLSYVVYLHETSEAYLLTNRLDNDVNLIDSRVFRKKPTPDNEVNKINKAEVYSLKDIINSNRVRRANQMRRRNIDELIPLDQVEIPPLPAFDPIKKSLTSIREEDRFEDKLKKLETFLHAVQFGVNDLHDALKHAAMVSKYNQELYSKLKDLYLRNPSKKQLLEVLLHLFGTRLVGLVEKTAVNGLKKKDYEEYIDENQETMKKTREEFVFVLRLIEELNKL